MPYKTKLDAWLTGIIEAGWLAALVLAPLFFNVFSSRVFEPDKISLIRSIALVMLLAWLIKLANGGGAWEPISHRASHKDPQEEAAETDADRSRPLWRRAIGVPLLLPIVLLIIAYLVSTGFSIARFVSWWGSYQRLQGTYTFLSYTIIALLAMGHLRRPEQLRRLQHAIIVTSVPISIYGILQHRQLDPLPWGGDVSTRVAANAGNAIFLAAYLIMAFFFTLERVYSSFAYLLGYKTDDEGENQDVPTSIAGGAYLFVLIVQLLAIFWTQSRGPWLGLFFGLYLFVLLLFTALRPARFRLLTSTWVGLGVGGALLLVLMNTSPLFQPLRGVPYLGRLTTMLEADTGTGRVRVLIWQGASEMVAPHEALTFPDGSKDALNPVRPLIGYGPEAMWIAYNRFYPPELAQIEARNASPDRAHNETWDALVITGFLGFLAYLALFVSIFYWALRWLGLLINRRDTWLFIGLLALSSVAMTVLFYLYDGGWRFFGVALPIGLIGGLGIYVTISAFLHGGRQSARGDLPRQLLLISLLASITAHFIEIHFGIAIAATRTYFWVQTAMLLVIGTGWLQPTGFTKAQEIVDESSEEAEPPESSRGRRRGRGRNRGRSSASRNANWGMPALPATVMIDLLIFLTLVFLFTTNGRGETNPLTILTNSIFRRSSGGETYLSPYIFFLLLFTWVIAVTICLTTASLQHRRTPSASWWVRGVVLHGAVVWGGWLVYGLVQATRLVPGVAGSDLNSQLGVVAGHFALFTWIVVIWLFGTGLVFAWSALQDRRVSFFGSAPLSVGVGVVATVVIFAAISNVNIALVRADIIYKQGQQFDAQGNWVSSVELYRRALNARRTEDHYMLFLGRALLEQAKASGEEGTVTLPESATLGDVLALTPEAVSQMSRQELLRAAEVVLQQAQRVNPLNTDHTANLARLYRSWADLSTDPERRQAMLDRSIEYYNTAVTLSPNAAHLWNEKGNAHLARGEDDLAEEAYLHSMEIDNRYLQTYLLLADFYERREQFDKSIAILEQGIEKQPNALQLYSYLGVAQARVGNMDAAIAANEQILNLQPGNVGAMQNIAVIYRDQGKTQEAIEWTERAIAITADANVEERKTLHQLAAQLYQQANQPDQVLAHYEQLHQIAPEDTTVLATLYSLYVERQDWNQAIAALQALAVLEPDNYQHPLALAQLMQQIGQEADALTYANQALDLAPDGEKPAIAQLIDTLSTGSAGS